MVGILTLRDLREDLEEMELASEGLLVWPDGGEVLTTGMLDSSM
jgi:hypothetical protein